MTAVRHPLERFMSTVAYVKLEVSVYYGGDKPEHPFKPFCLGRTEDEIALALANDTWDRTICFDIFQPASNFIKHRGQVLPGVETVCIQDLDAWLEGELGIKPNKHVNTSPSKDWKSTLSKDAVKGLKEFYAEDFEVWNLAKPYARHG